MNHNEKYNQLIETNVSEEEVFFIKTVEVVRDIFYLFIFDHYEEGIRDKLPVKFSIDVFYFKDAHEPQLIGDLFFVFRLNIRDKRIKYFEYDPHSDFGKYIIPFL